MCLGAAGLLAAGWQGFGEKVPGSAGAGCVQLRVQSLHWAALPTAFPCSPAHCVGVAVQLARSQVTICF